MVRPRRLERPEAEQRILQRMSTALQSQWKMVFNRKQRQAPYEAKNPAAGLAQKIAADNAEFNQRAVATAPLL